jgi:flagellin-like protein
VNHVSKKISMKNRRAVSNIIGSLVVLAVVASVGSVILFQGLNQINAFNYDLTIHDTEHVNEIREDLIFEHVWFNATGTDLVVYIANVGTVDSTITSVSVVKINTQELVVARDMVDETILIENHGNVTVNAKLPLGPDNIWNSTEYGPDTIPPPIYKINIVTSKGNIFSTEASPYNT